MPRRLVFGAVAKTCGLVVQFGQQFILVPIFLHFWGVELYRDWVVILSGAGFLTLLDLGLKTYYSNKLMLGWSRGEREHYRVDLHHGLAIYAILGVVALPILAIATYTVSEQEFLGLTFLDANTGAIVFLLLAGFFLAQIPLGLVSDLYRTRGEFARGAYASILGVLALVGATILALSVKLGPVEIAAAHIGVSLATWTLIVFDQKRRYPDLQFRLRFPNRQTLRDAFRVSLYYALIPLSLALTLQGMVLLIANLAPTGLAVVVFSTLRTITGMARQIANQVGQVVGNELSRQYAQQDFAAIAQLYMFLGRLCGGLVGAASGLILAIGSPFLTIWTLGRIPFDPYVLWALLAATIVTVPAQAGMLLLYFINRPRGMALAYLAFGAGAVALAAALIPEFGAAGAAVALLVAESATFGIILPAKAARAAGVSVWRHLGVTYFATIVALVLSTGAAFLGTYLIGSASLVRLVGICLFWALILAVPGFYLLFTADMRRRILNRLGVGDAPLAKFNRPRETLEPSPDP